MGPALARTPALVEDDIPVVTPDRIPPMLEVLVAFHPPALFAYGNPVPKDAELRTPWPLEDEVDCRVSVNVNCWVTKIVL